MALLWMIIAAHCLLLHCIKAGDIIQKPVKQAKQEVALVFLQGAQISTDQYVPLVTAIQQVSEYSVWVGIPEFPANLVEPLVIGQGIQRVLNTMKSEGMSTDLIFFAGHSLGGAVLQVYVHDNPSGITGQILMGSFIERSYQNHSYPVPTLTLGGELDGLCRVTRIMEAYYHYISNPSKKLTTSFPVIVIQGMSHMQFASGEPPIIVKERDLKPEISEEQAHSTIATLTAAFIATQLGNSSVQLLIDQWVRQTGDFVEPLIKAYEMEGFYYFKHPCYDDPPSPQCTIGCPWTEIAQGIMGDLPNNTMDKDIFHPVSQINGIHFPKILNNCSSFSPSCILKTITVSECIYEIADKYIDAGFFSTSASEIRAKLSSRQSIMEAAGMGKVDFNKTDGGSLCKIINKHAYNWALDHAGATTLGRFKKLGEPLVFGKDKGPYNIGPLWIYNPLEYNRITNNQGETVVEIRSPMLRTPTDFFIKEIAGFHYCKLLSPARAMEWIYIDSLRLRDSLNNSTRN